jgi:hypothetical protein
MSQNDYVNAVKAWNRDGKKYPLEAYMVTDCDCGCTNRK